MIIFLEHVCRNKVWGGRKIREHYGYIDATDETGEVTLLSGLKNQETIIKNGEYKGLNINQLLVEHRYLFKNLEGEIFPIICKIINAQKDLSLQVHPDDNYAFEHHNCFGKAECWYVLHTKANNKICIGHKAKTREEFKRRIERKEWNELLNKINFTSKDFIYIPAGVVHSVPKGTILLEISEPSDITYRIHDYERNADNRPLHIEKAIMVAQVPYEMEKQEFSDPSLLISNEHFNCELIEVDGSLEMAQTKNFHFGFVISGEGTINGQNVFKGDSVLIPGIVDKIHFNGKMQVFLSYK